MIHQKLQACASAFKQEMQRLAVAYEKQKDELERVHRSEKRLLMIVEE
jgi:hypothetical protein